MKIKEISKQTGLSEHTIRYYEKINLLQKIKKDQHGIRDFTEEDLEWLHFVKKMKLTQMPLKEIKIYADSYYSNNPDFNERIEILLNHQQRMYHEIAILQEALQHINYKINYYQKLAQK